MTLNIENIIRILANANVEMSAKTALYIAEDIVDLNSPIPMPEWEKELHKTEDPEHERLVKTALCVSAVMIEVERGKKIQAIKALRTAAGCGLKEAKDAVEDPRIWNLYNL